MANYNLPSAKPGQIVDADSVKVWFVNASVRTVAAICAITTNTDLVTFPADISGNTTGGVPKISVGDKITLVSSAADGVENPSNGTLESTVLAVVDATTVRISNVYSLVVTGSNMVARVYRTFTSIQATSGVDTAPAATNGYVTVTEPPVSVHGPIEKAEVHIEYTALRTDLPGVLEISDIDDAEARLGPLNPKNPLGLAVKLALANTVTSVKAISVTSDDLEGYESALNYLEGDNRVYSLVPLTQDVDITTAVNTHVTQMSTPEHASWRISLINTKIPTTQEIGEGYIGASISPIAGVGSDRVLVHPTAGFLGEGYAAGDIIKAKGKVGGTGPLVDIAGPLVIDYVLNNNQISIFNASTVLTNDYTDVEFTVERTLSKAQKAEYLHDVSASLNNKRVVHVQPDTVGVDVDGVTQFVPGYYLAAGLAGAIAGFPVQQGLTNIALAGFTDLKYSNFYFSRTQLNRIAEGGTCIFAQEVQNGAPYCRHELTTDMSVLANREILKVKNLDYLSYYYYNILRPFIGTWNVTEDTLSIMRQTIVAASEQLMTKRLPKIGAPLLGYNLSKLEQNANNKDNVDINLQVSIVDPNNYTNLTLFV